MISLSVTREPLNRQHKEEQETLKSWACNSAILINEAKVSLKRTDLFQVKDFFMCPGGQGNVGEYSYYPLRCTQKQLGKEPLLGQTTRRAPEVQVGHLPVGFLNSLHVPLHPIPNLSTAPLAVAQPLTWAETPCLTRGHTCQKTKDETESEEQNTNPTKTNSEIRTKTYNHHKPRSLHNSVRDTTNNSQDNRSLPEANHSTTASPESSNTIEAQEKDLKRNFMKMIKVHKMGMNKSLKGIDEKTI